MSLVASTPGEGSPAARRAHRNSIPVWLGAAGTYAIVSVLLTRRVWGDPSGRWLGAAGDPQAFLWWIEWFPHALREGLNPLRPTVLQHPLGTNALWNTSIIFPSLLFAPVTVLFGPLVTWNLLMALAPVFSALVAMAAIRRFTERGLSAAIGGLVYGFSPYMVVKMDGHPNLLIMVFPPLALICLHELFIRQRRPPVVVGALFGLAATAQLLTGEELLLTTAIVCGLTTVVVAVLHRAELRDRWRVGARGLAVAAVVALSTSAPFLGYQFAGPQVAGCCLDNLSQYVLDAETLVVPSSYQLLHTDGMLEIAGSWRGFNESNGYIGVPLIAVLTVAVAALRRRPEVVVSAIVGGVLILFAFGSFIEIGGTSTGIPGPWRLFRDVFLIGNIITARLMAFVFLAIAVIVAIALDTVLARQASLRRNLALAAVGVALLTVAPAPVAVSNDNTPPFFRDEEAMERLLPADAVAMVSPYFATDAMLWQATSDFRFRLVQGSVILPGPRVNGPVTPLTQRLNELATSPPGLQTPLSRSDRTAYVDELDALEVDVVILGPSPGRTNAERFVEELVRTPGASSGDVTVFVRPGRDDES